MDRISVSAFTACAAAELRGGTYTITFAAVQKERSLIKCERSARRMRTQSLPVWFYRALKSAPLTQKQVRAPQRRFQENPGWNLEPGTYNIDDSSFCGHSEKSPRLYSVVTVNHSRGAAELAKQKNIWTSSSCSPHQSTTLRKSHDQTSRVRTDGTCEPRVREQIYSALCRNLRPTSAVPKGVRTPTER